MISVEYIPIDSICVRLSHRAIKPWLFAQLTQSMKDHGYNKAYPIVVEEDGTLVEGRHRIESAKANGIKEVPFVYKPSDVSSIRFGLQCNADGQLSAADDVFDFAELCWHLSAEGLTGQIIAQELGWSIDLVSKHKLIKDRLHRLAWGMARNSTRNRDAVDNGIFASVDSKSTIVDWSESHFRAFLKHLPCPNGDRSTQALTPGLCLPAHKG